MSVYKYEGRHITGKKVKGYYEAFSLGELLAYLDTIDVYPIEIDCVDSQRQFGKLFSVFPFRKRKVSKEKMIEVLQNILTLYRSGVILIQAIKDVAQSSGDPFISSTFFSVTEKMGNGMTFSEACSEHPKVFDPLMIESLKIGEITGNLDKAIESQIERLQYENQIQKTIKGQSIYPIVLIVVVLIVFFVLTNVFIPKLMSTYEETFGGIELPPKAKFFIETNAFISRYSFLFPFLVGAFLLVLLLPRISVFFKRLRDSAVLKLPVLGKVMIAMEMARIAGGLHTCVMSGLSLRDGLSLVEQTLSTFPFRRVVGKARLLVESGSLLSQAFRQPLVPDMFISLVKVGETTGKLSQTMMQAQKFYLQLVKDKLQVLLSITGYLILLFLGLVVAYVILSVVIPMFEMPSVISRGVR